MTTDTETHDPRMFPALRLMEHVAKPTLYGEDPYWRAPITPPSREAFVPSWTWRHPLADQVPEGDSPITLDVNGAFLAALGSVEVAHAQLVRFPGELEAWEMNPRHVWPGYYLIDVVRWSFGGTIVSPLGNSSRLKTSTQVWVAHPTLVLLLELLNEGAIGELVISEAWVSERRCNFRSWNVKLKEVRNSLLDAIAKGETEDAIEAAEQRYRAFKEGYGAAFSMMLEGKICKTRRPDWAHAVYAQHAATSWRKAWRFSTLGPLLAMGAVDELTVLRSDLAKAAKMAKPPLKLDPSGRTLGTVKEKKQAPAVHPEPAPDLVVSEDWSDLL